MDQPDTHRLHHMGEAVYKLDRERMKAGMERWKHTQFGHGRAPGHQLADKIGAYHDDLWPDVGRVTVATVVNKDRQGLAIIVPHRMSWSRGAPSHRYDAQYSTDRVLLHMTSRLHLLVTVRMPWPEAGYSGAPPNPISFPSRSRYVILRTPFE
jgi:hypothetical protein